MKKNLKSIIAILIVLTLSLGIAGCGNSGTETPAAPAPAPAADATPAPAADPAPAAAEPVELRVLNYLDMSSPGAMEELDLVWAAFDAAHPDIKVSREDEYNDPYHNSIEAYAAAGTLPDVMYVWPSGRSTTLHQQKLLKDIGPLIERDGLADKYIPLALDPAQQAGGYIAMLTQGVTATNIFIINQEVLDAVGLQPAKTYSELVAQVPVLKEAGYETVMMPNQDTWVMQSCLFSLVVGRFMGENWEQRILSGETNFTDPDFIASLDFIKKMYDDGVLAQSSLALGYGDGPGQFSTNKAAYYIDGDWRIGAFITDASTGQALIDPERQKNFKVTVFPDIDLPGVKINKSNTAVLGTGWGISSAVEDGSDKLEAAWTLVKWLSGKEVQTFRLGVGGLPTPSWKGIDMASLSLEPLQISLAGLGNEYDKATVVIDGVFEAPVHTPINDGLQALGLGTQTSQQVAEITQAAYEAWKS